VRRAAHAVNVVLSATVGRFFRLLLVGLILGYRKVLSPLLGPRCRFYPSCSAYALDAVRVHGAAKGTALATWRVCRCHPWTPGGVDHVPPKGAWRSEPYVALEDHSALAASLTPDPDNPDHGRSAA
jgi:putative membrane protein insertion efficiency factor